MLARELAARACAAADGGFRLQEVRRCDVAALAGAGAFAKIKGFIGRGLEADETAVFPYLLSIGCGSRVGCHGQNLLFCNFRHI